MLVKLNVRIVSCLHHISTAPRPIGGFEEQVIILKDFAALFFFHLLENHFKFLALLLSSSISLTSLTFSMISYCGSPPPPSSLFFLFLFFSSSLSFYISFIFFFLSPPSSFLSSPLAQHLLFPLFFSSPISPPNTLPANES